MRKILNHITLICYMLICILSSNNDVLCIHENGHVSFESIINSDCIELNTPYNKDIHDNSISQTNECCDTELLKGIISYSSSIFDHKILAHNIITDYIKYISKFDINQDQNYYIASSQSQLYSDNSYSNHISTFVLLN